MKKRISLLLSCALVFTVAFSLPGSGADSAAQSPDGVPSYEADEQDGQPVEDGVGAGEQSDHGSVGDGSQSEGSTQSQEGSAGEAGEDGQSAPGNGEDVTGPDDSAGNDEDHTGKQDDESNEDHNGTDEEQDDEALTEDDNEKEDNDEEELELALQAVTSLADVLGSHVEEGAVILTGVEVTFAGTDDDVSEATDVDPWAYVSVSFSFQVPNTDKTQPGQYVTITLPNEICIDIGDTESYTVPIPLVDTDGVVVIASVTLYRDSQDMVLVFEEDILEFGIIYHAYFQIDCRFNGDELEDGGPREIVFEYDGEEFPITVNFRGSDAGLSKTLEEQGVDDESGAFTQVWRISANAEGAALKALELRDELEEGLIYRGFCFEGEAMGYIPDGWLVIEPVGDSGEIVFTHAEELSDPVVIYLYTEVRNLSDFRQDDEDTDYVLVENTATLKASGADGSELDELTATAMAPLYAGQLAKSGDYDAETRSIVWTLAVNKRGDLLPGAVLHDLIPDGLELDEDSIVIEGPDGALSVGRGPGNDVTLTSEDDAGGTLYHFAFPDPLEGAHTVIYRTAITSREVANEFTATNSAWLSWGKWMSTGVISDGVTGSTGMFTKYARGYSGVDQWVNWGFHVNENQYNLPEEVEIEDRYMPAGNTGNQGNPQIDEIYAYPKDDTRYELKQGEHYTFKDNEDGTFTLIFFKGVLDKTYVQVLFHTELLDWEVIAGNDSMHFYNEATMYTNYGEYYSSDYWETTPRVLNKENSYNRSAQEIIWTLTVNPFAYHGLGSVTVTDTLPPEVELVAVYRDAVEAGNLLLPGVGYSVSGGVLTFTYTETELDGKTDVLLVVTRITDDNYQQNFTSHTILNSANISMTNVANDYAVYSSRVISNTLVGKDGGFDRDMGVINWKISINSNALDWDVAQIVLTDPLPDGLQLDVESVRLERYSIEELGNSWHYVLEEELALDLAACVSYSASSNVFEFSFPKDAPSGYRYLLYFDTDVLEAGEFNNKITLTGFADGDVDSTKQVEIVDSGDLSGAIAGRKARIALYKLDENGEPLAGARFELRNADGAPIDEGISDEDGAINFTAYLHYQTFYYLHEVEAPEGYKLLDEPVTVWIDRDGEGNVVAETLIYTVENEPEPRPSGSGGSNRDRDRGSSGGGSMGAGGSSTFDPFPDNPGEESQAGDRDSNVNGAGAATDTENPSTGRAASSRGLTLLGALCMPAAVLLYNRGKDKDRADDEDDI